jgi:group II intron reverse transcriptase/maturase
MKLCKRVSINPKERMRKLYQHITLPKLLRHSYNGVRDDKNLEQGAGVDGVTFADIEREGVALWLDELRHNLTTGRYTPQPLKAYYKPKRSGGGQRKICVPTITDRTVMRAAMEILCPICDGGFADFNFAFRPGRSPTQMLKAIAGYVQLSGGCWVLKADIRNCFDSIQHKLVLNKLLSKSEDKYFNRLIEQWISLPIAGEERTPGIGLPQGLPISPILMNMVLSDLDNAWEECNYMLIEGVDLRTQVYMARYADDLILVGCLRKKLEEAYAAIRDTLAGLDLELKKEKTQMVNLETTPSGIVILGQRMAIEGNRIAFHPSEESIESLAERLTKTINEVQESDLKAREKAREIAARMAIQARAWASYYTLTPKEEQRDCITKALEMALEESSWLRGRKVKDKMWYLKNTGKLDINGLKLRTENWDAGLHRSSQLAPAI